MVILRRLMLLRIMNRRIDPILPSTRLLSTPGVYLTDGSGNILTA